MRMAFDEARYLPRTLRLIWAAAGGWTAAWAALLFIQGLLPIAVVYLVRAVVNALVAASATGGDWLQLRPALLLSLSLGGIMLLTTILNSLLGWVRANQADLVSVYIADLIHRKCGAADLAVYETEPFYNLMHQARSDAANRPLALLENIGGVLQSAVTLVGMAAVLVPLGLWLPLVLVIRTLPAFYTVFHFAREQYVWRTKITPEERRAGYFDWLLTSVEPAGETRVFGTEGHFRHAFQDIRRQLRMASLALKRREALGEFYAALLAHVITGLTLAWMVWRTLSGPLVLGDLVVFYQAFNQGQQMLRALLGNTQQIFTNLLFLGKLYEFLALEARVVSPAQPVPLPALRQGIRFEHVSFRYPGSARLALEDFNLEIPAGRITAILGPNGSGKSTVIKLLCRLYDPEAGRIAIDGVDLRAVSLEELRRAISPLFQVPIHYGATARENIALGDLAAAPSQARVEAAARTAGAHDVITRLPGGYDCMLGKIFANGTELSVGEWQRIALARAFLRPAPLLLLDEPTSAMDAWAETDWMERLRQSAKGRTTVVITHRLSTAVRADVIFVMERGRVVESGSHAELLAAGRRYAAAWTAQMRDGASEAATR
jgi:ATP-binding cassette subfamily B protein